MQNLSNLKAAGQQGVNRLLDLGKQQPEQVKTWGVTAASAVAGAVVLAAAAQGILALLATLASPPIALTIGAVGGGVAGWSFIQSKKATEATSQPVAPDAAAVAAVDAGAMTPATAKA